MKNFATFSAVDFAAIFKEEQLLNIDNNLETKGVSTDTRTITKGNLFVALKGEKFDAHELIEQAFNKGAIAAVVNRSWYDKNPVSFPLIIVDDTLDALGELAKYHRLRFDIKLVCVGGSNGKTTTKEMIASIFSQKYKTLKTYRNFNNRVGVPLMLLQLDDSYSAAVIEIATNQPGEISLLADIASPNYGVITNIGKEHLEQLMDLRGVELEETFLFGYLRAKGISLINLDDPILAKYTKALENFHTYGVSKNAQVQGEITINEDLIPNLKVKFKSDEININLKVFGYINAINALTAAAMGIVADIDYEHIKNGLENYEADPDTAYGRMRFENISGIKLINDCYNANPSSMRIAFDTFCKYQNKGKKIAVLGDMLELGSCSETEHINLLKFIENKANEIYLYGNEFKNAISKTDIKNKFKHFDELEEISEKLLNTAKPDDLILVKGSRGMRLEKVIENFKSDIN